MAIESPTGGIDLHIRLAHMRLRSILRPTELPQTDPFAGYLSPGITWEQVAAKYHYPVDRMQRIITGYTDGSDEYGWLKGNVGAGKEMMDEYRPAILAAANFDEMQAMYARVPHEVMPFRDPESGDPLFGNPVRLDLSLAEEGLSVIGNTLVGVIGEGHVDHNALSYYLLCWHSSAKTIMQDLRQRGVVVGKPLGEYAINPDLLQ